MGLNTAPSPVSKEIARKSRPDGPAEPGQPLAEPAKEAWWYPFKKALPVYLFILPGVILFLVWTVYPLVNMFVMSFFQWNLVKPSIFLGFDNYARAFGDEIFWQALRNTIFYAVISVPGQLILGLAVALLVNQKLPFRAFFRTMFYLPVVSSWLVVSLIFMYLYNSQAGLLNYLLKDILHIIPSYQAWLQNPVTALFAICALGIWKGVGWTMVIFLAGLQSVPPTLYESAAMDGANTWRRFWHITLPLIRPTIVFATVMLSIGAFNVFIQVYVMTGGGPQHSTETLMTYMYSEAFKFLDLGYGAALSWIFAIGIFIISILEIRFLRRPVEY
ncbi:MAG: sugar ABC transporter permease [Chloroflexi bacterium]|nr:sugar ABC transporter permease [Chloroflexota bacterium]